MATAAEGTASTSTGYDRVRVQGLGHIHMDPDPGRDTASTSLLELLLVGAGGSVVVVVVVVDAELVVCEELSLAGMRGGMRKGVVVGRVVAPVVDAAIVDETLAAGVVLVLLLLRRFFEVAWFPRLPQLASCDETFPLLRMVSYGVDGLGGVQAPGLNLVLDLRWDVDQVVGQVPGAGFVDGLRGLRLKQKGVGYSEEVQNQVQQQQQW